MAVADKPLSRKLEGETWTKRAARHRNPRGSPNISPLGVAISNLWRDQTLAQNGNCLRDNRVGRLQ